MITVDTFTGIIGQLLHEPHAGLLNGILFGTKATLDKKLLDALVITGTLHIVALSGMNISIIANLTATLLLRLISKRLTSLLTIIIIIGFILFVGPSPSVIRAGIMGSIGLLAIVFGRELWSLLSLILAVGIMLLLHPPWIGDLSFQLSALATLGIVLFGGTKKNTLSKGRAPFLNVSFFLLEILEDDLRITLAAQVFTIPLIFWYFHRLSLISPITNILIGWTIVPITALGFGSVIAGWLWLPLGYLLAWPAWVLLEYLIRVVILTSMIPLASVGW
jgi:competence protein ComEC